MGRWSRRHHILYLVVLRLIAMSRTDDSDSRGLLKTTLGIWVVWLWCGDHVTQSRLRPMSHNTRIWALYHENSPVGSMATHSRQVNEQITFSTRKEVRHRMQSHV